MPSPTRQQIHDQCAKYAAIIKLSGAKVLDVGTAGDPVVPGATRASEKFTWFGPGNHFKTLDNDPLANPDYVGDICDSDFEDGYWDLVILSQTLEHVWDFKAALKECYRITKPGGFFILDTPWEYPFHPTNTTPDYWRFSPQAYQRLLSELGWTQVEKYDSKDLISVLCQKPSS